MADTLMDRPGGSASSTAGSSSSNPASRGGDDRPGDITARARDTLDDAKQQAAGLASRAKDEGKSALSQQKEGAAEQVTGVAQALRTTADELNQQNPQVGRFVSYAAERLEGFGEQLRRRDLDTLIDDASRWGRESPVALFAGSIAVGFLLSRFLKSSASAPRQSAGSAQTSASRGTTAHRNRSRDTGAHDWSWSGGHETTARDSSSRITGDALSGSASTDAGMPTSSGSRT
jgi:hypothetical protein